MRLIAVAAMVLSTTAVAQPDKDWWACQGVHAWGVNWANNQWMTGNLKPSAPFVLMSDGNGSLTKESVAKTIDGHSRWASQITCRLDSADTSFITCVDDSGTTLNFDRSVGKGGISRLIGTTGTGSRRDTVSVSAFECTKG